MPSPLPPPTETGLRIVEIEDEREPHGQQAMALIGQAFPREERQPLEQIAMEIAEKRLGLLTSYDFHLFAGIGEDDRVAAISAGVYLGGVNAGFVTYLAVRPEYRARKVGRQLRVQLVEAFRRDAIALEWSDLAWVVGEVRTDNPWLGRLVRDRSAIAMDLAYYHPGMDPATATDQWVLYRQPVGDRRPEVRCTEVSQLLYAIWRRAYRVRWPLQRDGFRMMLAELEGRETIGSHPDFRV